MNFKERMKLEQAANAGYLNMEPKGEHVEVKVGQYVKYHDPNFIDPNTQKPMMVLCTCVAAYKDPKGFPFSWYIFKAVDPELNTMTDPYVFNEPFFRMVASIEQLKFVPYFPSENDDERLTITD